MKKIMIMLVLAVSVLVTATSCAKNQITLPTYVKAVSTPKAKILPVDVKLIKKINIPEDVDQLRFRPHVRAIFEIKNNTTKTIRGVQGFIAFKDMFGEIIKCFNCDFTNIKVKPNSSIIFSDLQVDINKYDNLDMRIYNTKSENLIFEYATKQIMFTDGSKLDYGEFNP